MRDFIATIIIEINFNCPWNSIWNVSCEKHTRVHVFSLVFTLLYICKMKNEAIHSWGSNSWRTTKYSFLNQFKNRFKWSLTSSNRFMNWFLCEHQELDHRVIDLQIGSSSLILDLQLIRESIHLYLKGYVNWFLNQFTKIERSQEVVYEQSLRMNDLTKLYGYELIWELNHVQKQNWSVWINSWINLAT